MKDFRILPPVTGEVAEAADWYDGHGFPGLGDRFIRTFYLSVASLQEHGEVHKLVYLNFRRVLLKPFPYLVYYAYRGDLLVISLVIHAARSPQLVRAVLRQRNP